MGILETLDIQKLKTLTNKELKELATEIRQTIISTVSTNGGHLSANLGVVELTMALHKVFNSPFDKIIFDVSHQCYTHKLLTERLQYFTKLRKYKGLSGFTKYSESIHDAFEAGHSSTSLSAGLGMLYAKENGAVIGEVIALIGDASVTNGLAFEALNNLGANRSKKMIIIINDNEMSISKNVGTLARTFNKIRVRRINSFLFKCIPRFLHKFFDRINSSVKSLIYGKNIFEALDFKYFEGIDGHNMKELVHYLNYAKKSKQSVVLHVKTQKGKGYKFAEEDNTGIWHNAPPFDIDSGNFINNGTSISVGEAIGQHLVTLIDDYPNIKVITPGMSLGSGLNYFKSVMPEHFIDVGIAEEHAVVLAASMAYNKLLPIVFLYATFAQRSYDQIIHDVTRCNAPVLFCIDRAGIVSGDGDTHQGIFDIGFIQMMPGVTIIAPASIEETLMLIDLLLRNLCGPVFLRYPKSLPSIALDEQITLGSWSVVIDLQDVNIITYGEDVYPIKNLIEQEKLPCGLINARFIKPIDENNFRKIFARSRHIIVYEQVIKAASLYSSLIVHANDLDGSKPSISSVSLPETYLETGTVEQLKNAYQITYHDLLTLIKEKL